MDQLNGLGSDTSSLNGKLFKTFRDVAQSLGYNVRGCALYTLSSLHIPVLVLSV
jgi:hypothetical protein